MRRWCSGIMQDSHSCDPGSIPGRRNFLIKSTTVTGLEPAIPRSEVWCLIRLATQPQVELHGY